MGGHQVSGRGCQVEQERTKRVRRSLPESPDQSRWVRDKDRYLEEGRSKEQE